MMTSVVSKFFHAHKIFHCKNNRYKFEANTAINLQMDSFNNSDPSLVISYLTLVLVLQCFEGEASDITSVTLHSYKYMYTRFSFDCMIFVPSKIMKSTMSLLIICVQLDVSYFPHNTVYRPIRHLFSTRSKKCSN